MFPRQLESDRSIGVYILYILADFFNWAIHKDRAPAKQSLLRWPVLYPPIAQFMIFGRI